ncbi:unnamed protein product [Prunus armeniaca]
MLWAAARATTIPWWEAEMEKMKEEDLEAWKWLVQRPPNNWTRSHFYPRLANRRAACGKWKHLVGPRIFKIIEKNKMGASQCIPRLAREKMYQVSHMYDGEDENPVEYVHECYKPKTYMRSYEPIVHPIPSMDHWVKGGLPPIRPQFHKRQPGRPKKVRTNEAAEVQIPAPNPPNPLPPGYTALAAKLRRLFIKIKCGKEGHNRRGCGRQIAKATQNGNVGQNELQAADNGNAGQNDIAPTQTNAALAQTDTALIQKKAAPTQTYTSPAQIQVVSDISQGRVNLPMTYSQQVPLQPSSSSLTQQTTPHKGRFKHSVKIGGQV